MSDSVSGTLCRASARADGRRRHSAVPSGWTSGPSGSAGCATTEDGCTSSERGAAVSEYQSQLAG